jgi:hypothetical protein
LDVVRLIHWFEGFRRLFHFLERNREFVRCEIDEVGGRCQITITKPSDTRGRNGSRRQGRRTRGGRNSRLGFTEDGWFGT